MPKRKRNYPAEYARRIVNAEQKGLSRSQARGHAKASESHVRPPKASISDDRIQIALKALRRERSLSAAARSAKVSPERLRKFAIEAGIIEKSGRRWTVNPALPRRMLIYSRGEAFAITVGNAEAASSIGSFMSAVARFLDTNKVSYLALFVGKSVRDKAHKNHPFETNPNALYRLAAGGEHSFAQIYRIVI